MYKTLTREEFIEKARKIHGDRYDYSKVKYINCKTKVCIICPIHGEFLQTPVLHYCHKQGCPSCKRDKLKCKIIGIGINDYDGLVKINNKNIQSYNTWRLILLRCYSEKEQIKCPTYRDCSVCDEWKYFSNFKRWFDENYIEGYAIDKDILIKGNKVYSPETCCFVPARINSLFIKMKNNRGGLPIGVIYSKNKIRYRCCFTYKGKSTCFGYFDTPESAFYTYKQTKELYIKEIANEWKDKIAPKVYEALMKYEVEITD